MDTTWKLTGKPPGGGQCEHCPRQLVHRYEVTNTRTGAKMTVGRGCLKKVTGWTLTAAQAEREIRMIAVYAERAARWAAFETAEPELAALILADCAAYVRMYPPGCGYGSSASHEVKHYIENGDTADGDPAWPYRDYMTRRTQWAWAR